MPALASISYASVARTAKLSELGNLYYRFRQFRTTTPADGLFFTIDTSMVGEGSEKETQVSYIGAGGK